MQITKEWLKEKLACTDGYEWSLKTLKDKPMDSIKFIKILMKEERFDWANWVIVRVMEYDQYVSYAVFAAEQVIDTYEKQYPDDKRPRNAIEAAKKCIGLKGGAARAARAAGVAEAAAGDAARAARAAGVAEAAAGDAARAAGDAAWAAAEAAAWAAGVAAGVAAGTAAGVAAGVAAGTAARAAWAAAGVAAGKQMQIKILEYGLSLLKD